MLNVDPYRIEVAQLCQRLGVKHLEIFGSATTTRFGPGSDVDFLVEFDRSDGRLFDRYFDLKEGLEALFSRPADVVMIEAIRNPYFRAAADASRRPLYVA